MNTFPKKSEREQGIALVIVILSAMVLIVALLAVTSTLALSSRRTTTDQRVTLQAQYAAESGLSRARSELVQIQGVLQNLRLPANTDSDDVEAHARSFCKQTDLTRASAAENWSPEQRRQGVEICEAKPVSEDDTGRFSLFDDYVPRNALPRGANPQTYWAEIFGGKTTETLVATDPDTGAATWYRTTFGLTPQAVRRTGTDSYRFGFTVSPVESVGEVRVNGEVVASRTVRLETPGDFDVSIERPGYPRFVQFRNNTQAVGGGQLSFGSDERFDGHVHTNGVPGFSQRNGVTPRFFSRFTSAARTVVAPGFTTDEFWGMFEGERGRFGVSEIPLPTNNNNQLRASFGGDAKDSSRVYNSELRTAWNVPETENGIYYSRGDGSRANQADAFQGGIYVKGDVSNLTLSTRGGKQVIEITSEEVTGYVTERRYTCWTNRWGQRQCGHRYVTIPTVKSKTTTFTQKSDNSWSVNDDGKRRTLSGNFNGMIYVDGNIESLGGDGTDAADVAARSQLTLATTGDVKIKQSLTYTDNPREDEDALNVLGIFSDGGNVLLDGPLNQDLNVHASVMASAQGNGFGTVNPGATRGRVRDQQTGMLRRPKINLIGGIIEDQSQTVSITGGGTQGGFSRNYARDPRFADGFSPPFFPTQENWEGSAETFSREQGLWEVTSR